MKAIVVLDTNILISSVYKDGGASRIISRKCLLGEYQPIIGAALYAEYESKISHKSLFNKSLVSLKDREVLYNAFLNVCKWVKIYYSWRPNLRDESDNHLIELAVAGGAKSIITNNKKDFNNAELNFPEIRIISPKEILKEGLCQL